MNNWFADRPSFKNLIDKKNLVGVEIGVDMGVNAEHILKFLDIEKLYLVDPWKNYGDMKYHGVFQDNDEAEENYKHTLKLIEPFKDKVVIVRNFSQLAAQIIFEELDFVYIDGNHRYDWVRNDIITYWPKIKDGGQLAGHDFKKGEPGIRKAVEEAFGENYSQSNWDWWKIKETYEKNKQTIIKFAKS